MMGRWRMWIRGKSRAQSCTSNLSLFLKRNGTCMIVVPCRAHVIFFNNK